MAGFLRRIDHTPLCDKPLHKADPNSARMLPKVERCTAANDDGSGRCGKFKVQSERANRVRTCVEKCLGNRRLARKRCV